MLHRLSSERPPYFTDKSKGNAVPIHAMQNTERVHVQLHSFLTSTTDGTHSRSERFSERQNLLPLPGFEPRAAQLAIRTYTYYVFPAPHFTENKVYLATLFVRMPQHIGQYRVQPRNVEPYFDSWWRRVSSHKYYFYLKNQNTLRTAGIQKYAEFVVRISTVLCAYILAVFFQLHDKRVYKNK